jgi:transposase
VVITPYQRPPASCRPPRENGLTEVVKAMFYTAQTGCQWRMLGRDLPPFAIVQRHFPVRRATGRCPSMSHVLLRGAREIDGRDARPSADIIHSQATSPAEGGGPHGYAADNMVEGRRRHGFIGRLGLLAGAVADAQDGNGASLREKSTRSPLAAPTFADSAYARSKLEAGPAPLRDWVIEIVRRYTSAKGVVLLARCGVVAHTSGWPTAIVRLAQDFRGR